MKLGYFLLFLTITAPFIGWWALKPIQAKSSQKVLIVGTNPQFPPFEFVEDGKMVGFDIDLMNAIGQEMGAAIEWHSMPFDSLIPGLQIGSIQIIAAGMTPTAQRAQKIFFSQLYLSGDQLAIITRADHQGKIANVEALKDKTVVVNEGFTSDFYVSKLEGPHILRLETPVEAFLALDAKRADAFVASHHSAMPFLEKYGVEKYTITPITGTNESSALGISKEHPQLLNEIQNALDTLIKKGFIEQLKTKWKLKFEWAQQ